MSFCLTFGLCRGSDGVPTNERGAIMLDLQGFEIYLMREERSENTIACYLRDVRGFIEWHGTADLCGLAELDLIRYKKYLNAWERTVITANRKLASVNAFCRYLCDVRELPEVCTVKLTKSRDKPEYKGLPVEDLRCLREHIHAGGNTMHVCIIELLLATGLRVSELAGLTLNDIELEENPHIRVLGKGCVNRTLPLNAAARAAVEEYIEVRGENAFGGSCWASVAPWGVELSGSSWPGTEVSWALGLRHTCCGIV